MQVTAKADYAIRACAELAGKVGEGPVKGERLATAQGIPLKFLENIMLELRRSGIVLSQRGAEGGYWLAKAPGDITLADVVRAVDGPLAAVRGQFPEDLVYEGAATHLNEVWIAVRAALRSVLAATTLADLVSGKLPKGVKTLTADKAAWTSQWT